MFQLSRPHLFSSGTWISRHFFSECTCASGGGAQPWFVTRADKHRILELRALSAHAAARAPGMFHYPVYRIPQSQLCATLAARSSQRKRSFIIGVKCFGSGVNVTDQIRPGCSGVRPAACAVRVGFPRHWWFRKLSLVEPEMGCRGRIHSNRERSKSSVFHTR